jgi:glutathione S-transferase
MRLFIQNYSLKLASIEFAFVGWNRKNEEERKSITEKHSAFMESLNSEIQLPYALGEEFSLADVLIYPFFEMWVGI